MVMAVAILVSAILLIFVVPMFEDVFAGFGAELPAFTQLIVSASRFMVSWWWLILGVVIAAIVLAIMAFKRSEKFQHFVRSEEHTSELQSLMRISYAVFCLKKKKQKQIQQKNYQ